MMKQLLHATALCALAGLTQACGPGSASQDRAVMGAVPAVSAPVGPVPGPGGSHPGRQNPYKNDAVALAQGRQLFVTFNCAGCHGGHAGGGMGPSLRDDSWIYGSTSSDIFDSIAEGRAHGMPAWGSRLPEQTIWQLTAYIESLRTPSEPSPPT